MPWKRSDMRRMKEVLRLGYSLRQIAESVRLGRTSVRDYLARADVAGVRYEDVAGFFRTHAAARSSQVMLRLSRQHASRQTVHCWAMSGQRDTAAIHQKRFATARSLPRRWWSEVARLSTPFKYATPTKPLHQ